MKPTANRAFTLMELLVTITILAILIGLIIPAGFRVIDMAKSAKCLGNVRSFGNAGLLYVQDNAGMHPWNRKSAVIDSEIPPVSYRPRFESWVRPYLHKEFSKRLRCPLWKGKGSEYSYNYTLNSGLAIFYPKLINLPVSPSRVVFAAEFSDFDHFYWPEPLNQITWGSYDGPKKSNPSYNNLQYHGTSTKRGLHMFFLDGHAALICPDGGNWVGLNNPDNTTYWTPSNKEGIIYDYLQLEKLKNGVWDAN